MARITPLAPDLTLIDAGFAGSDEAIAVYLLSGDRPALLETGPASTVESVLAGIRAAGMEPRELQAVAVTHIHLDHAGGAGTLARRFPHLDVYFHPVGAPHLADPSRLLASAGRLYGDTLQRLFGETLAVPAGQLRIPQDGDAVALGSRRLVALDTPGHARHHLAYLDEARGDLFTGDVAGVALPGSRHVRPPTPPPEFDLEAWQASIARLRAVRPRRLLLTHFGAHEWADDLLAQLAERLPQAVEVVQRAVADGLDEDAIVRRLHAVVAPEEGTEAARDYELVMPLRQSALGLIRYVMRARVGRAST